MGMVQVLLDQMFVRASLADLIKKAVTNYEDCGIPLKKDFQLIQEELSRFLAQRLGQYFKRRFGHTDGFSPDLADAILCGPVDRPIDLFLRFVALVAFRNQPGFEPLITVFKRASRILPVDFRGKVNPPDFKESVERILHEKFMDAQEKFRLFHSGRQYGEALEVLAGLREPIDNFFNGVMVMDKDLSIRNNRFALLWNVVSLFGLFGDFTRIATHEKTG